MTIVESLIGLQAQQSRPPFIGLWSRIDGFVADDLRRLLRERQVVRVTLMRGTLHLVSSADYLRFRTTFQPLLTAGMHSILKERATDMDIEAVIAHARGFFHEQPRTFADVRTELMSAFPEGDERAMGYATRMHLPVVGEVDDSEWCYKGDRAFALAETWLSQTISPESFLEELVRRYLAAFGPATAADFQAWSGLSGKEAFEKLRPELVAIRDEKKRELFDIPDAPITDEAVRAPARLIADYDNAILGHAKRDRILPDEYKSRVVSKNLIVQPTFLVDGFVAGTWAAEVKKKATTVTIAAFAELDKVSQQELAEEAESVGRFLGSGPVTVECV